MRASVDNARVLRTPLLFAALLLIAAAACQGSSGPARPASQPSVRSAAGPIQCPATDHGIDEVQLGWGFCYPATWKFRERVQPTQQPPGVDATFDIVVAPPTGRPQADQGLFAFMIIGTYDAGGSSTLKEWAAKNIGEVTLNPISWGNAREAAEVSGERPTRIALTAHHVVLLDIRAGAGNLDLDQEMAKRLGTWRFDY